MFHSEMTYLKAVKLLIYKMFNIKSNYILCVQVL